MERTRELGVRAALGATPADLIELVVGEGTVLTVSGLAIGAALAVDLSRLLRSLLFGVTVIDAVTWTIAMLLLTAVALLACYVPARDAARADPLEALRVE